MPGKRNPELGEPAQQSVRDGARLEQITDRAKTITAVLGLLPRFGPQLPNQSVQAARMRDRLASDSTASNNGTPRRFRPLMTARRHPSKGCRLRMMTTEVGRSWEWVVCGVFVRHDQPYYAVPMSAPVTTAFRHHLVDRWLHAIRRRGQKRLAITFIRGHASRCYLPYPRIQRPWPEQRFLVNHPR